MNKPQKILIIPNISKRIDRECILSLINKIFEKGCSIGVLKEHENEFSFALDKVDVIEDRDEFGKYDIAIVLGGDGSIIDSANRLLGYNIPILGINYGHVGYLAELETDEIELVDLLFEGNYFIDERTMLDATVFDKNENIKASYTALNDFVISNGPVPHLIKYEIYCDDIKIESCRADGFVIATPTGSTAYSLSAGGPVLDPSLDCTCLTPICSHTLNSRPVIVRGNSTLVIKSDFTSDSTVYFSADGREIVQIFPDDKVVINKSAYITKLLRIKNFGFLEVLRNKLADF